MIARGIMLGPDQPVILHLLDHLLDIEQAAESLHGIRMGLTDAALPLLKGVVATTDIVEACKDVNIAVMLGGSPRKEITLRKDLLSTNVSIYKAQALALEKHAAANCKVCVVANPANTNALILKQFAPSIPKKNITCLTRLDHNRALGQIAERIKIHVTDIKNVIIWGITLQLNILMPTMRLSPPEMERDRSESMLLMIIGISTYPTCLSVTTFTCLNYLET